MKRILIASIATLIWLATFDILLAVEYLYPAPAPERTEPIIPRSYSDYVPYLGGAYRHPDAYLPTYPGYAPYWQRAPYFYWNPYLPAIYPYPFYSPIMMPVDGLYGPTLAPFFEY